MDFTPQCRNMPLCSLKPRTRDCLKLLHHDEISFRSAADIKRFEGWTELWPAVGPAALGGSPGPSPNATLSHRSQEVNRYLCLLACWVSAPL